MKIETIYKEVLSMLIKFFLILQLIFIIFITDNRLFVSKKLKEVLQRHNLIVELDMRPVQYLGALNWVRSPLRQRLYLCSDRCYLWIRNLRLLLLRLVRHHVHFS